MCFFLYVILFALPSHHKEYNKLQLMDTFIAFFVSISHGHSEISVFCTNAPATRHRIKGYRNRNILALQPKIRICVMNVVSGIRPGTVRK